jgi:hypothetical protein
MIKRRTFIALGLAQLCGSARANKNDQTSLERGRSFLAQLIDPALDLLPEFDGSNVYWLWHDNALATKTLATSHPDVSQRIASAIERERIDRADRKVDLFFGDKPDVLPFRHYELTDVRTVGEKQIRTEIPSDREMKGWASYADLLLLATLAEKDPEKGRANWNLAAAMWDGVGFFDAAAKQHRRYATYKLGIALVAAHSLTPQPEIPRGLVERLQKMQSAQGGWITDYRRDGTPLGKANVETTCMAILGLEQHVR